MSMMIDRDDVLKSLFLVGGASSFHGRSINLGDIPRKVDEAAKATLEFASAVSFDLKILAKGYVAGSWSIADRVRHFCSHRAIVKSVGGVIDVPREGVKDFVRLSSLGDQYRVTLDRAVWMRKEGQLVFSLWEGVDRIFSVAFCLSSENGKRIAYVGAIQGRCEANILERYKVFSKVAHGMRTRDFLVEIFKIFCRGLNVDEIRAVSVSNKHNAKASGAGEPKLCYDDVWRDRGGTDLGNGFFSLPVASYRDGDEQRATKKKANYLKRYDMFDAIEADMATAFRRASAAKNNARTSSVEPDFGMLRLARA